MNTPRGLNTKTPRVRNALMAAATELRNAGIALSASLRAYQYVDRNGAHIPIPVGRPERDKYDDIESKNAGYRRRAGRMCSPDRAS